MSDRGCTLLQDLPNDRWVCMTHDCEVVQALPDAYTSNPTAGDFLCPIGDDPGEQLEHGWPC